MIPFQNPQIMSDVQLISLLGDNLIEMKIPVLRSRLISFVRSLIGRSLSSVSVTSRLWCCSSGKWINVIIVGNSDRVSNGQRVRNSTWDQQHHSTTNHVRHSVSLRFRFSALRLCPRDLCDCQWKRQYRCWFSGTPSSLCLGLSPLYKNFDHLRSFSPRHRINWRSFWSTPNWRPSPRNPSSNGAPQIMVLLLFRGPLFLSLSWLHLLIMVAVEFCNDRRRRSIVIPVIQSASECAQHWSASSSLPLVSFEIF